MPAGDVRLVGFAPGHVDAVHALCAAEGWHTMAGDRERLGRILQAPGVTTVVALSGEEVVGFAQLMGDGELQGFLATMTVAPAWRGQGVARALVREVTRRSGVERVDLLSEENATGFYAGFPHFAKPGFRLYPFHGEDQAAAAR